MSIDLYVPFTFILNNVLEMGGGDVTTTTITIIATMTISQLEFYRLGLTGVAFHNNISALSPIGPIYFYCITTKRDCI